MRPSGPRKALLLALLFALLAAPVAQGADGTRGGTEPSVKAPAKKSAGKLKVLGVGFAAEGMFIMVNFTGSALEARKLVQGTVSVTDEATGIAYTSIPTMPKIGPLLGHTRTDEQVGYVMLINTPEQPLKPGALVTVVLGSLKVQHVKVGGESPKASSGTVPPAEKGKR